MLPLTFAGLLSTPAPTAPIIGVAFMALFGIMAVVVGPNYDGFNDPNTSKWLADKTFIDGDYVFLIWSLFLFMLFEQKTIKRYSNRIYFL